MKTRKQDNENETPGIIKNRDPCDEEKTRCHNKNETTEIKQDYEECNEWLKFYSVTTHLVYHIAIVDRKCSSDLTILFR